MVNVNEIDSIRLILFSIAIDIIILSYYECRMVKINDDGWYITIILIIITTSCSSWAPITHHYSWKNAFQNASDSSPQCCTFTLWLGSVCVVDDPPPSGRRFITKWAKCEDNGNALWSLFPPLLDGTPKPPPNGSTGTVPSLKSASRRSPARWWMVDREGVWVEVGWGCVVKGRSRGCVRKVDREGVCEWVEVGREGEDGEGTWLKVGREGVWVEVNQEGVRWPTS